MTWFVAALLKCLASVVASPDVEASYFPLIRTPVIHWICPDNSGDSLHLKCLKSITPAKSLLPHRTTCTNAEH